MQRFGLILGLGLLALIFLVGALFGPIEKTSQLSVKVYASEANRETLRSLELVCNDKPSNKELCEKLKSIKADKFASREGEDCKPSGDRQYATVIGTVNDTKVNTRFTANDSCQAERWDEFEWLLGRR